MLLSVVGRNYPFFFFFGRRWELLCRFFFFLVNRESNINYEVLLQEPKGTILVRAVPNESANKKGITTGGGELKRLQTEDILAPNLVKASAQQLLCSLYHIAFILLVW